jgi:hypothetical protein
MLIVRAGGQRMTLHKKVSYCAQLSTAPVHLGACCVILDKNSAGVI